MEERFDNFTIDSLSNNASFVTTTYATQIAIRNHQRKKLEALRNEVLNSALVNAPEEDIQLMFLNFIEYLTTSARAS